MSKRTSVGAIALPVLLFLGVGLAHARDLTFEQRVDAQRAIEQVYWSHRIWLKENSRPKPALDAVMPESAIRAKVTDYLRKSNAVEKWWHRAISGEQLQAELDRMIDGTHAPEILKEIFDALGDDPFLIAETLGREALVNRLIRNWYARDERVAFWGSVRTMAPLSRLDRRPNDRLGRGRRHALVLQWRSL